MAFISQYPLIFSENPLVYRIYDPMKTELLEPIHVQPFHSEFVGNEAVLSTTCPSTLSFVVRWKTAGTVIGLV